ncbi:MAG: VOC family protein [Blastocatellia bacterium]
MKLNVHLNFNGDCAAAYQYYEQHLGAKTLFSLTYAASPMAGQFPAEYGDKLMHATLEIGETMILGADTPPEHYKQPDGFCLTLGMDDPAEAERVFSALAAGGNVTMPLQQTFWAQRFGMVTDQFGIPWMVNCGDPSPAS